MSTVADAVLAGLAAADVDTVFGFPGETSLPLYIAAQRQSSIRHVLARCPRCAGYMADAFARVSGTVGICDAPGGIGSPFTTPALLEAFNSSTPLVFLASGVSRVHKGRWTTGECSQQALFSPVCKAAIRLETSDGAGARAANAVRLAEAPRSGPVFFEIPSDILVLPCDQDALPPQHAPPCAPSSTAMATVARTVREAKSVVIVAGGGVHSGSSALRELVTLTGLPVATTLNGKGAVDETLPNALGVAGAKGSVAANGLIRAADCIIAIGTKLGDKSSDRYRWPAPGQTLVHVDSSSTELVRFGHPSVPVLADATEFCLLLAAELAGFRYAGPVPPRAEPFWDRGLTDYLCGRLSTELDSADVVVADASVSSGWAGAAIQLTGGRQRLLTPRGSGSIGYALPAALGAKHARPGSRVFAMGGDGGFSIAMHEMETAVRERLPVTYFLLNNQRLGLIDRHAVDLLGGNSISSQFGPVDWQKIGAAFGWRTTRVRSSGELDEVWDEMTDGTTPSLVECVVSADENAPDFVLTSRH